MVSSEVGCLLKTMAKKSSSFEARAECTPTAKILATPMYGIETELRLSIKAEARIS